MRCNFPPRVSSTVHSRMRRPVLACAKANHALSRGCPFSYVDGLSFLYSLAAHFAASGLTAVPSATSRLPNGSTQTTGSVKFFRSFEACARSLTADAAVARQRRSAGRVSRHQGAARSTRRGSRAHRRVLPVPGLRADRRPAGRLDLFYELGLRVLQITHHNDNTWGGGAIEKTWTGLTKIGHGGRRALNALGIIPDLSHVSDRRRPTC